MKNYDLQTEVAEILLDCESPEDVEDAIDEIKDLAEKGKEIEKEIKRNESVFKNFMEEEVTRLEAKRIKNRLSIAEAKANGLMADAFRHLGEICKDDKDALKKVLEALKD